MPPEDDRDKAALFDIVHAARLALQYVEGMTRDAFFHDDKTQDAVIRRLIVLGEAAKRLSEAVKTANPQLPWKQMAGMRDVIVHDYDRVELDIVWTVLEAELPALLVQMEPLVD